MKARAPVSLIIPCYRCSETIGRAIESVAAQTVLPTEVILVDDHSEDDQKTLSTLKQLQNAYPELAMQVLPLSENKGPGSARNEGWKKSSQPYITFLDSDDAWHSKKIEIQYSWMNAHPNADLSAHLSIDLSKNVPPDLFASLDARQVLMSNLLLSNYLPCRSVMIKSDIGQRFLEGKRQAEDYLLWLNIGFQGGQLWFLNQPLAYSFKDDFGQQGLNAHLEASHQGVIETYRFIYQRGYISLSKYYLLRLMCSFKHLRRIALSKKA